MKYLLISIISLTTAFTACKNKQNTPPASSEIPQLPKAKKTRAKSNNETANLRKNIVLTHKIIGQGQITIKSMVNQPRIEKIESQRDFANFLKRIPKLKVQMKQPAPPNPDPILKQPEIDFSSQMVVVIYRSSIFLKPKIVEFVRSPDDKLLVKTRFPKPDGIIAPATSRNDIYHYQAALIKKNDLPLTLQIVKKTESR
ncbi:MAG: hypothetical protein PF689_00035 [Deltaproteobacteria bacterium]|nr:hypothetical protein [Deltaproteobacteria bacterium]